jgi:hypothetical protein
VQALAVRRLSHQDRGVVLQRFVHQRRHSGSTFHVIDSSPRARIVSSGSAMTAIAARANRPTSAASLSTCRIVVPHATPPSRKPGVSKPAHTQREGDIRAVPSSKSTELIQRAPPYRSSSSAIAPIAP